MVTLRGNSRIVALRRLRSHRGGFFGTARNAKALIFLISMSPQRMRMRSTWTRRPSGMACIAGFRDSGH